MKAYTEQLQQLQEFYQSGRTMDYTFRKEQLLKLKDVLLRHEKEISAALYQDLKKNPEESWVTETGFIIAEINHCLRHLKSWMKPEKVKTNLLNFPSRSYIYKEPLGVVMIIGPWNYPVQLLLAPLVGAIAGGNCIVLKPSELAPATAAVIKKMLQSIYPPGFVYYVEGDGAEVVPALIEQFRFAHIFFTGSTSIGRKIYQMAAQRLVPVTLELGGKSPCVVEEDADIPVTARRIAVTKFSNAGQMCVAPDYLLVHHSIKEALVSELKKVIHQFFSHNAANSYDYGKIINERQFNRLVNYLQHGTIVMGGGYDARDHHIEPTLLENVPMEAAVMGDEIFGPVLPIIGFRSFEEAKAIINRNPDPLAFYVFTRSREKEKKWLEGIHFGGGCVNNASWHLTNFNLPFGGRGNSGIGAYHGKFSFDLFSHRKAVMKTPLWFDPKLKYPPFRGKLSLLKKLIN